jgi:hypothetical protein
MNTKKILVGILVIMFICSMIPSLIGQAEDIVTFKERKYKENRDVIPIYTKDGLIKVPNSRGKPPSPGDKKPSVTITNPSNGDIVSGTVTIMVTVNDKEDDPDPTPVIRIDGEVVATALSYDWNTEGEPSGDHTITATATDSVGNIGSDSVTVNIGGGSNPVNKYALVIGISDYESDVNDLEYCDDDAMDWKNFLQGKGYSVNIITDSQATAANIENALYDLIADEDGNDYVVLTYSGHGYDYPGYGSCIISHDEYYMTHGYFESFFDTADSPHIYFAFDACEIGGFQGLLDTDRVGAFASNRRLSYDGDSSMKNGVFTYYQMEGWTIYDNFEEDAAHAVQEFKNWAPRFIKVDPFYKDQFAGPMLP